MAKPVGRNRWKRKVGKVTVRYADGTSKVVKQGTITNNGGPPNEPNQPTRRTRYEDYLRSSHWKKLRKAALERDGHRCRACGRTTRLHVHHHTYERMGHELLSDVVTLCHDCHEAHHRGANIISKAAA